MNSKRNLKYDLKTGKHILTTLWITAHLAIVSKVQFLSEEQMHLFLTLWELDWVFEVIETNTSEENDFRWAVDLIQ